MTTVKFRVPATPDTPRTGPSLALPESIVIVIVITWATVLVLCGLSADAALGLLAGAGVLGVRLARQARV